MSPTRFRPVVHVSMIPAGLILAALALGACGSTQGKLLNLPCSVGGVSRSAAPDAPLVFTTPAGSSGKGGWTVTLTNAVIAAGPFYFNNTPPPTQGFRDGTVIMELASQTVVDTLDPTLYPVTGGAQGLSGLGSAISVEVDLFPYDQTCVDPANPICTNAATYLTDGDRKDSDAYNNFSQVFVAGTAAQGAGTPVAFEGWITLDSYVASQEGQFTSYIQRVAGADTNLDFESDSQTLEIRVDPTHWFDTADFSVFQAMPLDGSQYYLLNDNDILKGPHYTWSDLSTFEQQLVTGITNDQGVYLFSLNGGS